MIVRDGDLWSQQQQSLRDQGDEGKQYLEFLEFWADAAERLESEDTALTEMAALRAGLEIAEETFGRLPSQIMGQMLCLLVIHWQWGEEIAQQMTVIEHRILEEALIAKLADQQQASAKLTAD
jgi:hypothetical protein